MTGLEIALTVIAISIAGVLAITLIVWGITELVKRVGRYYIGEGRGKSKEKYTKRESKRTAREVYKFARNKAKQQYKETIGKI